MTRRVHYEVEVLFETVFQPLCENQSGIDAFSRDDDPPMTIDPELVTCRKCLTALGHTAEVLGLDPKERPDGRFQVAA